MRPLRSTASHGQRSGDSVVVSHASLSSPRVDSAVSHLRSPSASKSDLVPILQGHSRLSDTSLRFVASFRTVHRQAWLIVAVICLHSLSRSAAVLSNLFYFENADSSVSRDPVTPVKASFGSSDTVSTRWLFPLVMQIASSLATTIRNLDWSFAAPAIGISIMMVFLRLRPGSSATAQVPPKPPSQLIGGQVLTAELRKKLNTLGSSPRSRRRVGPAQSTPVSAPAVQFVPGCNDSAPEKSSSHRISTHQDAYAQTDRPSVLSCGVQSEFSDPVLESIQFLLKDRPATTTPSTSSLKSGHSRQTTTELSNAPASPSDPFKSNDVASETGFILAPQPPPPPPPPPLPPPLCQPGTQAGSVVISRPKFKNCPISLTPCHPESLFADMTLTAFTDLFTDDFELHFGLKPSPLNRSITPADSVSNLDAISASKTIRRDSGLGDEDGSTEKPKHVSVLDDRRAHTIDLIMRQIKLSIPELVESVRTMDTNRLSLIATQELLKLIPTEKECQRLEPFRQGSLDITLTGPEKFLLSTLSIPMYEDRVRALQFMHQSGDLIAEASHQCQQIMAAMDLVQSSITHVRAFLQYALTLSVFMRKGSMELRVSSGFRLGDLLKLVEVKSNVQCSPPPLPDSSGSSSPSKSFLLLPDVISPEMRAPSPSRLQIMTMMTTKPKRDTLAASRQNLFQYLVTKVYDKEPDALDFCRTWSRLDRPAIYKEWIVHDAVYRLSEGAALLEKLLDLNDKSEDQETASDEPDLGRIKSQIHVCKAAINALQVHLDVLEQDYHGLLVSLNEIKVDEQATQRSWLARFPPADFMGTMVQVAKLVTMALDQHRAYHHNPSKGSG